MLFRVAVLIALSSGLGLHDASSAGLDPSRSTARTSRGTAVLYVDDFEDGGPGWYADGGVWEVDIVTSGPGAAHSGVRCVATNPHGNYPNNARTHFISPSRLLPAEPLDGQIWLRFWHALDMVGGNTIDQGRVQVSRNGGAWEEVPNSTVMQGGGSVWGQALYDLSAYAGSTIRIAFWFQSNSTIVNSGWYIDDVSIEEGALEFPVIEDFEDGFGDFSASSGIWEVGTPTFGPSGAHSGSRCAGTILSGTYPNYAGSRLVSPPVALSATPQGGQIWLRFWHALDMVGGNTVDQGRVQVSRNGGAWEEVPNSTVMQGGGSVWGQALYDLSTYAGSTVRIAFWFQSNSTVVNSGWYIDDVSIEEGALEFPVIEDFEDGFGDFSASSGIWEVGTPTFGPSGAHSGSRCAGTVLSGTYPNYAGSRLASPPLALSATPRGGQIWLRYWQALDMVGGSTLDQGRVQVSRNGGAWEEVPNSTVMARGGNTWGPSYLDLSAYAGSTVQIAFWFQSNSTVVNSGWFIDDVSIHEGPPTFRGTVEGFETGTGGWYAANGVWEIGPPTSGPAAAYQGELCAGTNLGGEYPPQAAARLVTPPLLIEPVDVQAPVLLRYQHWFSFSDDDGRVDVKVDGGAWTPSGIAYSGTSGGLWAAGQSLDLSGYVASTVQVSFLLTSTSVIQSAGWFIDTVELTNLDLAQPTAPENLVVTRHNNAAEPPGDATYDYVLAWNAVLDPDVAYYAVYRGASSMFLPDFSTRIALTTETGFVDTGVPRGDYHYKVASVDTLWNESDPVAPDTITGIRDGDVDSETSDLPPDLVLLTAAPNPFNPTTTIGFALPARQHARLTIYDVAGRRTRVIVDEVLDAGHHTRVFDATGIASGVYFCRLETASRAVSRKIALVK